MNSFLYDPFMARGFITFQVYLTFAIFAAIFHLLGRSTFSSAFLVIPVERSLENVIICLSKDVTSQITFMLSNLVNNSLKNIRLDLNIFEFLYRALQFHLVVIHIKLTFFFIHNSLLLDLKMFTVNSYRLFGYPASFK